MLGLGVNRLGSPRKGGFSLRKLFKATSSGFLGAINDPTTLSQSSSSSVAVTSAGDPIGRESRVLGSFDLTQATSANRATWARRPRNGIRNRLLNNTSMGGSAGSPGTLPTDTSADSLTAGFTRTLSFATAPDGTDIIRIRIAGTAAVTSSMQIFRLSNLTAVPALQGQTFNASAKFALSAGSWTGVVSCNIEMQGRNSGGSAVGGGTATDIKGVGSTLTQYSSGANTFSDATTAYASAAIRLSFTSGVAVDFTLDINLADVEMASTCTLGQVVRGLYDVSETGQPYVYHSYYDGVSDYLTSGVQSFGTASLHCVAGQAWTIGGNFRTTSSVTAQTIAAKAGATAGNRTLMLRTSTAAGLECWLKGQLNTIAFTTGDGVFHTWVIRWDGTTAKLWFDNQAVTTLTVGTAAEEAENITIGARTDSSAAGFALGHNDLTIAVDRALSDAEVTAFQAWQNQTFRYGL